MKRTKRMCVDSEFQRMCDNMAHNMNEMVKPGKPRYKPIDVTRFLTSLSVSLDVEKDFKRRRH